MENNETKTLWISIGCAIFAVFLLYSWSQEKKAEMHKKYGAKKQVVIAAKDITEMEPIDESMIEVSEAPEDYIQPAALQSPEQAIGQLAAAPIKKGEQILNTKLLVPGKDSGLSSQVSPGKRAFSIPANEINMVAQMVKPGDRIDILTAVETGQGIEKKKEVRTIMQDVTILAVGQNIVDTVPAQLEEDGKNGYTLNNLRKVTNFRSITIEASPSEAQLLFHIISNNPGGLFATLRNSNDRFISPLKTVDADDVMGKIKAARIPAEEPKPVAPPAPVKPAAPKKSGAFEEL